MKFMCELYREQVEAGRWILHEHPVGATSWKLEVVIEIMKMEGVYTVVGDQCQFGLEVVAEKGREDARQKAHKVHVQCPRDLEGTAEVMSRRSHAPTVGAWKSREGGDIPRRLVSRHMPWVGPTSGVGKRPSSILVELECSRQGRRRARE